MSPIPRGPHLGVLAKTRPRHHSGPIRGVVPGTARIRETTALGGHGADRRYWPEPQFDRGTTPAPGAHGKESERCPSPSGVGHLGSPGEYGDMEAARRTSASSLC